MADWTIKQGDTLPVFTDTLTYADGSVVDLTGASVKFVMRARSQSAPTTNLAATIVTPSAGTVSYTPTVTDTANAGLFQSYWNITFGSGATQRVPTVGYNTVEIQENLETTNETIVELDDIRDYLNLRSTDRAEDGELLRFAAAMTPVVEQLVGPVIPRVFVESYDGGSPWISVRHRPIISVETVIEVRANIPYNLEGVATRDLGTIYSFMFDTSGRIIRTTAGGGLRDFPAGSDQVTVTYTAGRLVIPENIKLGTLMLIAANYQQTQQGGAPIFGGSSGMGQSDQLGQPIMGYLVPNRVRELLAPSRRHPAIA